MNENTTLSDQPVPQTWLGKWGSLIVLSLALAIIVIDTTLLNVSLGTIIRDLHTNIQSIQWVITAYSLMLAAFTITGGRLGDLFGRKRMFMLGAIIFALGSFTASISTNVSTLIIGESIIEGIGAALMMPATSSLLVSSYKGRDRAVAFGVWGGIAAASSAIGPILGGYLTTNYSWRWGFRINVFIVVLLLLGAFIIKESRDLSKKIDLDFGGVILSALGMLSIVFGVIKSSDYGWFKAKEQLIVAGHALNLGSFSVVPIFILIGLVILGFFIYWEKIVEARGKTPLVSLHILSNRTFSSGVATTAVLSLGQAGLIFSLPVFLQGVRHLDALHTGLAMLPLSLALLFAAPFSAYIGKHFNAKPIIQVGLLIDVIALLVLRASTHINTTPQDLILGMALYGIGMGLVFGQISNLTLSSVSVEEAGEASGINNTLRQVGSTFGSAIIGAVLLSTLTAHLVTGINQSPIIPIQIKDAITQNVTAQTSNVEFGGGAQVGTTLPENIQNEIESIGNAATTEGSRTASAYAALFAFFGLLVSFFLPKHAHVHDEQVAMAAIGEGAGEDSEADIAAQGKQIPSDAGGSMAQSAPILASSRNNYIGISFAALILIIAGLSAGYGYAKHRDAQVTKDNAPLEQPVAQQSGIVATPQPVTEPSTNNPAPTTPATPQSPVTPAPTQTYLNNSIGLQFSIPAAWTMHETFGAKYAADFYDQSVWTAEVSVNPGSNQSINDLYQEISADPQNTQITAISIAGASGYQFFSQAHNHIARAMVYRGNTYYFLGALNDATVQKSLKLF